MEEKEIKDYDKFLSSVLGSFGMEHWYVVNFTDFAYAEAGEFHSWGHALKINSHIIGIREKKKFLGIIPYPSQKIVARIDSEPRLAKDLHEATGVYYQLDYNGLELTLFDLSSKEKIEGIAGQLEKKFGEYVKIKIHNHQE